jgi:hypothetical protein
VLEGFDNTPQKVSGSEQRPAADWHMITRDGTPRCFVAGLVIGWFFPSVVRAGLLSSCRVMLGPPEGGRGGRESFKKLAVSAVGSLSISINPAHVLGSFRKLAVCAVGLSCCISSASEWRGERDAAGLSPVVGGDLWERTRRPDSVEPMPCNELGLRDVRTVFSAVRGIDDGPLQRIFLKLMMGLNPYVMAKRSTHSGPSTKVLGNVANPSANSRSRCALMRIEPAAGPSATSQYGGLEET